MHKVIHLLWLGCVTSWRIHMPQPVRRVANRGQVDRRDAITTTCAGLASLAILGKVDLANAAQELTTDSGIKYTVVQKGNGPSPKIGELAAVRFTGAYNGIVFDDLFKTAEPLYFRVGVGSLVKGIDEVVQLMKVGDRWRVTVPGELAFGRKGRSASPGKPRIPPFAAIDYDLQLVSLPGREVEIIDLNNFDPNAPASDDSAPPGVSGF